MIDKQLASEVSNHLLPYVQQPAQYIGREWNQLVKDGDWEAAEIRVAVAFPDAYTIGMSHLGCQIIYWLCNHTAGVCAERVYAPWTDAEAIMRSRKMPLFTWDTRQPVGSADIFAVSLQYELGFTNLLNMLELAEIPILASKRDDSHPIVIAGGPQADNPEPVADFIDLVVIGDGEASMAGILDLYGRLKASGVRRREMIEIIAREFPWIYAPSLYAVSYGEDGTIERVAPRITGLPAQIERCQTLDFENAPFPERPLVPYVDVVHDRIAIEVMRGCPQRCRFCHAGYTKRPVGVRSVEKILSLAESQYRATGHSELGLLSLSTADYPHLKELSARINEHFDARRVSISMPSLRVDKMLQNIPWMASNVRKSGLTIAVEAARDRMRAAIRKKVTDGNLIDGILEAYKAGWNRVKCYYMVGFPGETPDDIEGIYDISVDLSEARRRINKGPAKITASVSWLVPKPYTPFQWAAQPHVEYFQDARRRLSERSRNGRNRAVTVKAHDPQRSILEAVLSRGDRRLGATILSAFRRGARFDGWDECFDNDLWRGAFDDTGIDPDWYAHRERSFEEILPWDHIRSGPKRDYLEDQYSDVYSRTEQARPQAGIVPLHILSAGTAAG
ncbi:MAG: TIGR03960 family B12-binding radical SAM protein [Phycisphaerales bacterium]|nr:TIGR03960 family B12-binding radical SAM protein [Phycisphaerales bacterium]MCB9864208.1 TIGR03960 family B12-binding radical SAM protein [Phycisphaerales bacterium]